MNLILDKRCNLQAFEQPRTWRVLIARSGGVNFNRMPAKALRLYGWLATDWVRLWV